MLLDSSYWCLSRAGNLCSPRCPPVLQTFVFAAPLPLRNRQLRLELYRTPSSTQRGRLVSIAHVRRVGFAIAQDPSSWFLTPIPVPLPLDWHCLQGLASPGAPLACPRSPAQP